jgi:hypothetical protein
MKHLKKYESIEDEPQIDDYVICIESDKHIPNLSNFINNNIGKITNISKNIDIFNLKKTKIRYNVQYNRIPNNLLIYFQKDETMNTEYLKIRPMTKSEIIYWSKNKADAEQYLITNVIANKYNF